MPRLLQSPSPAFPCPWPTLQDGELTDKNCSVSVVGKGMTFTLLEDEALAPYIAGGCWGSCLPCGCMALRIKLDMCSASPTWLSCCPRPPPCPPHDTPPSSCPAAAVKEEEPAAAGMEAEQPAGEGGAGEGGEGEQQGGGGGDAGGEAPMQE